MKEKLKTTHKATSDKLEELEYTYDKEHLCDTPYASLINDFIQIKTQLLREIQNL